MGDLETPQDSSNVIFPRRKQGQNKKNGRKEGVAVTIEILETVFHMPLHKACTALGVCATALKRACRKLGVQKWPYRDQQCQTQRKCAPEDMESSMRKQMRVAADATAASAASRDALISMGITVGKPSTSTRLEDSTQCSSTSLERILRNEMAQQHEVETREGYEAEASWLRGAHQPTAHASDSHGSKATHASLETAVHTHFTTDPATPHAVGDENDDEAMSSSSDEPESISSSAASSPARTFSVAPRSVAAPSFSPSAAAPTAHKQGGAASNSARSQHQATRPKFTAARKLSSMVSVVTPIVPKLAIKAAAALPAAVAIDVEELDNSETQDSSNVIFPRRKLGQQTKHGRKEGVLVTMELLETVFHMPLHKACNALGVCATALKRACRKLGVQKWPYRDQQCQSQRSAGASHDDEVKHVDRAGSASAHRSRATGGMREGTRGNQRKKECMIEPPARSSEQAGAVLASNWNSIVKTEPVTLQRNNSQGNLHSQIREHSSDFESSVDTQIADGDEHDDGNLVEEPYALSRNTASSLVSLSVSREENLACDDLTNLMAPATEVCADLPVWRSQYGEQEDEFDSLDSEEDGQGLGSDELDSWVIAADAHIDNASVASTFPSLEDCLLLKA